ncbi:hypothetical protein BU24DRAFT_418203 [Aaosphaeria arxii CBS 175.79]|uniref:Uncharacterized protein n=1 Tax=Aaosphaeria arxii CBS 175.79 TaxID=1450172 RepID=A0A6A5Y0S4_9PLEO|nr:uncharacterized protein BU24DRAFT_418203 [Aaosphaeria arxii CBS 175.79]KAF2018677.1 hypothetical protein BU24DRAFT_418203 [Aaosphaeria arxii CBS 175.79]
MASIPLHSIPRFLLPRGPHLLRPRAHPLLPITASLRHASTTPRPRTLAEQLRNKQPVIPQPDKYRPPSHGKRTPRSETQQKSYGPKLTAEDKQRMRTKKYPNMMSPEGTFSHWFLNNKAIHLWISMGILVTLAIAAWYMDFMSKTIFGDQVPDKKDFLRHPIESASRFIDVYKMHVAHESEIAKQKRLKKAEEVEKRKQYRLERIREAEERGEEYQEDPRYYVGEDGIRRRKVKRWFGIWE